MIGRRSQLTRRDLLGGAVGGLGAVLAACGGAGELGGAGPVSVKGPGKVELGHYFAQGPAGT